MTGDSGGWQLFTGRRKPTHGKIGTYTNGCRCELCTAENTQYHSDRRRRLKENQPEP